MTDAPEQQPATPTEPQTQPAPASRAIVVTWLGEDYEQTMENEHGELEKMPLPGPSFMYYAGRRFDRGKPELIDPDNEKDLAKKAAFEHILKKAPLMTTTFKVEAYKPKKAMSEEGAGDDDPAKNEPEQEHEHEQELRTQPRMAPPPKRRR